MAKATQNVEIEVGDLVEIVAGDDVGMRGLLDNVWSNGGVETYTVILDRDGENFRYATVVKLVKKSGSFVW